ncbi:MAG TPA: hypothetical protein VE591_08955 [Candidatus Acidoferrum sp.]|nr:hypothetical protein [Candidatus Acidoferrum sp.]
MMNPDLRAAHDRFADRLRAGVRHLGPSCQDIAEATIVSYAAALVATDEEHERAWRAFVAHVAALARRLEHAHELGAELRALVSENADLLEPATPLLDASHEDAYNAGQWPSVPSVRVNPVLR